jgi:hypothetical protein
MATTDLEEFISERLRAYDPNIDLTTGSNAQQQIIQPLLRRVGADPFTMSVEKFIGTRLVQEFPEISTEDGDGIMDLLVSSSRVLLEPLVQEVKRVKDNLSFKDPDTLTLTEAESLGANYFSPRNRGDFARVTVRVYFSAPQNCVITPGNYCTTGTGLRFLPTAIQSVASNQMLFNKEGSYYYFDVAVISDSPGDGYNVDAGTITSIYGVTAAVKVTNKLRAVGGLAEESAAEYIDRIEQDLTERSLVTERGILAVARKYFPSIIRAAIVGFNDPEMQRDILVGAGIGPIIISGSLGYPVSDGTGGSSRRFRVSDAGVDFTALIGPVGFPVHGYSLTVAGTALLTGSTADLPITAVIDSQTVEVSTSSLKPWYTGITYSFWMLRKNELTISGVPGGTALPGVNGEVVVESGEVHIGGMTDIFVRGATTDQGSITLSAVTDDAPLLQGIAAARSPVGAGPWDGFILADLVLGTNYLDSDAVYTALDRAKDEGRTLQIMDGDAGSYRILDVLQITGQSPVITTEPAPAGYPLSQRWKLLDTLDIDLRSPRETKLTGTDLFTIQGHPLAQVTSAVDLSVYGIGIGDFLELLTGPDVGVYSVAANTTTNQLTLDRAFKRSTAGVSYRVYRKLTTETLNMPLVRIKSVDVLDSGGQPIGVTIPYADPVDVRAFDFTTPTNTLMVDIRDGIVGCVGAVVSNPTLVNGKVLQLYCPLWSGAGTLDISFSGITTLGGIADRINSVVGDHVAGVVAGNRIGIAPFKTQYTITARDPDPPATSALSTLFDTAGGLTSFATNHIRSTTINLSSGGWSRFTYDASFDAVQVISTSANGFAYAPVSVQSGKALSVSTDFPPSVYAVVRVGPRAVGRVRCYFLEPTTFEAYEGTRFTSELEDGTVVSFLPDPTISTVKYPPPPTTERAKDGFTISVSFGGTVCGKLMSSSVDFIKKGILPGDKLFVDFVPITGTKAQAGPNIPGLSLATFIVRIDGTDRTIVFSNNDSTDLTAVTLAGVEDQLNRVLGPGVAKFNIGGFLEIEASYNITIVGGTAAGSFWLVFPPAGVSNWSLNHNGGTPYTVFYVYNSYLLIVGDFLVSAPRQQFTILRPASQRVGITQMSQNTTYAGLYFADIQVVSEGTGPLYNLPAKARLDVAGHRSLGYRLSTVNEQLSFSIAEQPWLHVSPAIISIGASDDPENAIQVAGQNLQISYEWASVVSSFQSFVSSDAERVTNENVLVRHLLPHLVRFDITYRGGATETNVRAEIAAYVNGLNPDEILESVRVQNIPIALGATSVSTPVDLVAIVHQMNRKMVAEQSSNYLNTGRLAGFFVDAINVQRRTS